MSSKLLGLIDNKLEDLGIPYEFGEWTSSVSYPYFVGSFSETEHRYEDGYTGGIFTIDGWSRESKISLVEAAEKIKKEFDDLRAVLDGTAFYIADPVSSFVPTGERDLYRVTITLNTNEWEGE